jgi:uncharacterized protein YegL
MSLVYNRRLPIYLLLDCSESLAGEPLVAVAQGVASLLADLRGDPMALETVYLSVITFAGQASVAVPLTELMKFQPPPLRMGSGTALGAALRLLMTSLDTDVVKTTATQRGDWKPLCLILTDGAPTDKWKSAADEIRDRYCGRKATIVAIACGEDADTAVLERITPTVFKAADLRPDTLKSLFKWVSASVSVASARLDGGTNLPPLPDGKMQVAEEGAPSPDPDRFLFLHARCGKSKQFYVIRYRRAGRKQPYEAVAACQAPDFDFGGGGKAPDVPVEQIGAPPPCPYCRRDSLSICACGKLFCSPPLTRPVALQCPWCGHSGSYAPTRGGFDVGSGAG